MRDGRIDYEPLRLSDLPYRRVIKSVGWAAAATFALQTYTATEEAWEPTKAWAIDRWDSTVELARSKSHNAPKAAPQPGDTTVTPTPAAIAPQQAEITAMYRTLNPEQRQRIDLSARVLALGTIEDIRQRNALAKGRDIQAIDGRFYAADGEVVDPHALMFSYKDGPAVDTMVHVQEEYVAERVRTTVEIAAQNTHDEMYGEIRQLVFRTPVRPNEIMYVSSTSYSGLTYTDLVERLNDSDTVFESGFVVNKTGASAASLGQGGMLLAATATDYQSYRMGEVTAVTDPHESMNQLIAIVDK